MGLLDIAGKYGGDPRTKNIPQLPQSQFRMPWGSGFEGMAGMSDMQRQKMLQMMQAAQMGMASRFMKIPTGSGG